MEQLSCGDTTNNPSVEKHVLLRIERLPLPPDYLNHQLTGNHHLTTATTTYRKQLAADLEKMRVAKLLLFDEALFRHVTVEPLEMHATYAFHLAPEDLYRVDWDGLVKGVQDVIFRDWLDLNDVYIMRGVITKDAEPSPGFDITCWTLAPPLRQRRQCAEDSGYDAQLLATRRTLRRQGYSKTIIDAYSSQQMQGKRPVTQTNRHVGRKRRSDHGNDGIPP